MRKRKIKGQTNKVIKLLKEQEKSLRDAAISLGLKDHSKLFRLLKEDNWLDDGIVLLEKIRLTLKPLMSRDKFARLLLNLKAKDDTI